MVGKFFLGMVSGGLVVTGGLVIGSALFPVQPANDLTAPASEPVLAPEPASADAGAKVDASPAPEVETAAAEPANPAPAPAPDVVAEEPEAQPEPAEPMAEAAAEPAPADPAPAETAMVEEPAAAPAETAPDVASAPATLAADPVAPAEPATPKVAEVVQPVTDPAPSKPAESVADAAAVAPAEPAAPQPEATATATTPTPTEPAPATPETEVAATEPAPTAETASAETAKKEPEPSAEVLALAEPEVAPPTAAEVAPETAAETAAVAETEPAAPAAEPAVETAEPAPAEPTPEVVTAEPAAEPAPDAPIVVAEAETEPMPQADLMPADAPAAEPLPEILPPPDTADAEAAEPGTPVTEMPGKRPSALPGAVVEEPAEAEDKKGSTFKPAPGLPRAGEAEDAAPTDPATDPAAVPADPRPIAQFAASFENPDAKPPFAIVLIDDGSAELDRSALAALPFPVSFALDPLDPATAEHAATYRAAGREVVMLVTGIAQGAVPSDVEVAFQSMEQGLPEAVAVMDLPETSFQNRRPLAATVVPILKAQGRGLLTWDQGLNAADQVARREDLEAGLIFRDIGSAGTDTAAIRRLLDRAVFKAGQDGRVSVVGKADPATVAALLEWSVEGKAATVALAPVTAVLTVE
ncbi:MAG TPA: divergent polysaccharide deacetylase family protein [Tabrizicola sp.]